MKISLKRVNFLSKDMAELKKLYLSAFPEDERAPLFILASKARRSGVDFWSLYADGKWFGLAYAITVNDLTYLFYLAVSEEMRGRGFGSRAIQALMKKYSGNRFFLALEQPDESAENYSERLKRRQFYINNGLVPLNITIREGNVTYDVMGTGGEIDPAEYTGMMKSYLGAFLAGKVVTVAYKNT